MCLSLRRIIRPVWTIVWSPYGHSTKGESFSKMIFENFNFFTSHKFLQQLGIPELLNAI